jgi:hypothetical protein
MAMAVCCHELPRTHCTAAECVADVYGIQLRAGNFLYFLFICKIIQPFENLLNLTTNRRRATVSAVGQGGCRSNRRSPRRLGQRPRAPRAGRPVAVTPRWLRPIRRATTMAHGVWQPA